MKALYYYYYLFYANVYRQSDPHLAAKLALSASESFLVIAIIRIFFAYLLCYEVSKYYMFGVAILILAINFSFVFTSERATEIVKAKPQLMNSYKLSIVIAWLFFGMTASTLFWLGDFVNYILAHCSRN